MNLRKSDEEETLQSGITPYRTQPRGGQEECTKRKQEIATEKPRQVKKVVHREPKPLYEFGTDERDLRC